MCVCVLVLMGLKSTGHLDVVQDLSYDYYGRRMATCSTDRSVKVWLAESETGQWRCICKWHAHHGSVSRVRWAHPEFGASTLITCGLDCKAIVWEEKPGKQKLFPPKFSSPIPPLLLPFPPTQPNTKNVQNTSSCSSLEPPLNNHKPTNIKGGSGDWHAVAELNDSKKELRDVAFSPPHMGLRVATASADGYRKTRERMPQKHTHNNPSFLHLSFFFRFCASRFGVVVSDDVRRMLYTFSRVLLHYLVTVLFLFLLLQFCTYLRSGRSSQLTTLDDDGTILRCRWTKYTHNSIILESFSDRSTLSCHCGYR